MRPACSNKPDYFRRGQKNRPPGLNQISRPARSPFQRINRAAAFEPPFVKSGNRVYAKTKDPQVSPPFRRHMSDHELEGVVGDRNRFDGAADQAHPGGRARQSGPGPQSGCPKGGFFATRPPVPGPPLSPPPPPTSPPTLR